MGILNDVNEMYKDHKKIEELRYRVSGQIADEYTKATYYYNRMKTVIHGSFIYLIVFSMLVLQFKVQTNLINWIFFTLCMMNFALLIRGSNDK
jgi:hypothetical protein